MPYVTQDERRILNDGYHQPASTGQLNYKITQLVSAFLGPEPRYNDFNAAIGALECAKLELYRRLVAPYEDRKIVENGDVYAV